MSTRLVLLCVGVTRSAREARFPDPAEPLDEGGGAKVRAFGLAGPATGKCWISPAVAARNTAALLGLSGDDEPALRDMDAGEWTGRGLDEIEGEALARWLAAPERGAPGGESMAMVLGRVGPWLEGLGKGSLLAITHAAVVRAAIAHALDVPVAATLGIDVAPLSATLLSRHERWRLQELRRA